MGSNTTHSAPFVRPQHLIDNPETNILDLYNWNAANNANAPLLRFADDEGVKTLSWAEVNKASHRAAAILQAQAGFVGDERPVLAIFANTGTPVSVFFSCGGEEFTSHGRPNCPVHHHCGRLQGWVHRVPDFA